MNTSSNNASRSSAAFTLIELLVVIAVIGVLAALILPVGATMKRNATIKKAQAELQQTATAIEAYKEKQGFYPPENPIDATTNALYYELLGARAEGIGLNRSIVTLDGSARIPDTDTAFITAFGRVGAKPAVGGFANCTRGLNADDAPTAKSFLTQLRPAQWVEIQRQTIVFRLLTCSVRWSPDNSPNPWHYRAASATNNAGSFDLWINIFLGGKTNRISNWNPQPQIVNDTY
jgi:prepilin-type N-terminal cleavage/methylation domain-containing protein